MTLCQIAQKTRPVIAGILNAAPSMLPSHPRTLWILWQITEKLQARIQLLVAWSLVAAIDHTPILDEEVP